MTRHVRLTEERQPKPAKRAPGKSFADLTAEELKEQWSGVTARSLVSRASRVVVDPIVEPPVVASRIDGIIYVNGLPMTEGGITAPSEWSPWALSHLDAEDNRHEVRIDQHGNIERRVVPPSPKADTEDDPNLVVSTITHLQGWVQETETAANGMVRVRTISGTGERSEWSGWYTP
ncbi:hypothetical protein EVC24_144 [Rhizobium phage RHph_I4]|nr:hypothetical protein EVC24_144 [Rhizobium phage RHph_I4]